MLSDIKSVANLVELCALKNVRNVVVSPGSRNAPLTISFDEHAEINCFVVPDERSAAFFALGMALELQETVALCCTSGSASLNYAPAVAEAYYQKAPLLILTADRPSEWVNQGDGQTIQQKDIYGKHVRGSFELPMVNDADTLWHCNRIVNEAINTTHYPVKGPVHINIPLREPLYGTTDVKPTPKVIEVVGGTKILTSAEYEVLNQEWNAHSKKLILCGQSLPNSKLQNALERICADGSVAVLTETTANLGYKDFNGCIDRTITGFTEEDKLNFKPDLLITLGDAIISKKIKQYLRVNQPTNHWHVDAFETGLDTFKCLTRSIACTAADFFGGINISEPKTTSYKNKWKGRDLLLKDKHIDFLERCAYSDLKVFDTVLDYMPENSVLHTANSTAVRYVQLFDQIRGVNYYANRGTSGIDGSTSTAIGMAVKTNKLVTLITGDMSFFYDSNAFWNKHQPSNLRVIIVNNAGGGIFRIIPGPSSTKQLENYFETKHDTKAEHLAKTYDVNYRCVNNLQSLEKELTTFYTTADNNRPKILEVETPNEVNNEVLKGYFRALNLIDL